VDINSMSSSELDTFKANLANSVASGLASEGIMSLSNGDPCFRCVNVSSLGLGRAWKILPLCVETK
jgi:hypothetical protein